MSHPIDQSAAQNTVHIAPFLDPEANSLQTGQTRPSRQRNSASPRRWQRHIPFTKKWYSSVAGQHDQDPTRSPYQGSPASALDPDGPDRSWEISAQPYPPRDKRTSKMWSSMGKSSRSNVPTTRNTRSTRDATSAPTAEAQAHGVYRHGHGSWDSQISDTPTAFDTQHSPPQLLGLKEESLAPHHGEERFQTPDSHFERNSAVEIPEPVPEGLPLDMDNSRNSSLGIGSTLVPNFSRPELTGAEGMSRT